MGASFTCQFVGVGRGGRGGRLKEEIPLSLNHL